MFDNIFKVNGSKNIIDLKVYKGDIDMTDILNQPICTGMRFVLAGSNPNEVTNIDFIVKSGDVNGDGRMDMTDAQLFLETLVGNEKLEGAYELAVKGYDDDSALKNLRKFLNDMPKN